MAHPHLGWTSRTILHRCPPFRREGKTETERTRFGGVTQCVYHSSIVALHIHRRSRHHSHSLHHEEGYEDERKGPGRERRDQRSLDQAVEGHVHRMDPHIVEEEGRIHREEGCVCRIHLEHSSRRQAEVDGGQENVHGSHGDSSREEVVDRVDRSRRSGGLGVVSVDGSFEYRDVHPESADH